MKEAAIKTLKDNQFTMAGFKVDKKLLIGFADSFESFNVSILTVHLGAGQGNTYRDINACVLPLTETAVSTLTKAPNVSSRRKFVSWRRFLPS